MIIEEYKSYFLQRFIMFIITLFKIFQKKYEYYIKQNIKRITKCILLLSLMQSIKK